MAAVFTILERLRTRGGVDIAEEEPGNALVGVGLKAEARRIGNRAFHELAGASGRDVLAPKRERMTLIRLSYEKRDPMPTIAFLAPRQ